MLYVAITPPASSMPREIAVIPSAFHLRQWLKDTIYSCPREPSYNLPYNPNKANISQMLEMFSLLTGENYSKAPRRAYQKFYGDNRTAMTAKTEIPDWELIEQAKGISQDGMFATVIEVWAHKHDQRFATFTSTRPVLGFKCPTTVQLRLSPNRPQNDYGILRPPSGDAREIHALSCCRQQAWRINKQKLRGNL